MEASILLVRSLQIKKENLVWIILCVQWPVFIISDIKSIITIQ